MTSNTIKKYLIDYAELMKEWDFERNSDLNPSKLLRGSNKIAGWICHLCNNKWKTSIYHRTIKKSGCRKCSSTRRLNFDKSKSFSKSHPDIAKDWCLKSNGKLSPEMFPKNARYEANWCCHKCGEQTKRSIKSYIGCNKCKKKKQLEKDNLALDYPELIKEWDTARNAEKQPSDFKPASNKHVWWSCSSCKHSWSAKISNRSLLGRGCPVCSNKIVVIGKNDLQSTHPELAEEWDYQENGDLKPTNVTYGSGKKVNWVCSVGHKFSATVLHRFHGTNCPQCHSGRQTSFAEQAIYFYVQQLYPDAINRYTADFLGRMELDIYIPSIKYAIEYDGEAWHKKDAVNREKDKYQRCKNNGIKLIRLREKLPDIQDTSADYQFTTDKLYEPKNLEKVLNELIKRINFSDGWLIHNPIDINIQRDRLKIQQYRTAYKSGSMAETAPHLIHEWHPTKNETLMPDMFKAGSNHKAVWLCSTCNHEFIASIVHRTRGTGCPLCAVEKVTQIKRKPVEMIDPTNNTILRTFISISDASRKMGISDSNIATVCKGKRPKAGGYVWRYAATNEKT